MNDSKYTLVPATDLNAWDQIIDASGQATLFSKSNFLNAVGCPYQLFLVMKGNETKAGVALVLDSSRKLSVLHDYVIHNGLFFCPPSPDQKPSKTFSEQFKITEFIVENLSVTYPSIALSLAPQIQDIRPFLWHNYHSSDPSKKFKLDLRYTSYLDISELAHDKNEEEYSLFKGLEVLRQRNIREARKELAEVIVRPEIDRLISFHRELLKSQKIEVPEEKLNSMKSICEMLIERNQGKMFCFQNSKKEISYIVFHGIDNKRAYYLFGAGSSTAEERYRGTITFWDSFKYLAREGVQIMDFEGVNSPQRGAFKLSFGGNLVPYFQLQKD